MFYFLNVLLVVYNLLLYAIFRSGISDYLCLSKISEARVKASRKGLKNYWLYSSLHKQNALGALYYLNIVFFFYTVSFSIAALALGFIKAIQPILFVASIGLCIVEIPCIMVSTIWYYRRAFGKSFVFLARRPVTKRLCSSLFDMCSWILTVLLLYLSYLQL